MIMQHTRDSITLTVTQKWKDTSVTLQNVKKKEWVFIIITSKAKPLDEKELGWYNWLDIAHFSQSNMKHPMKTVKWYWCNKKYAFIEPSHVCENDQSYLECGKN